MEKRIGKPVLVEAYSVGCWDRAVIVFPFVDEAGNPGVHDSRWDFDEVLLDSSIKDCVSMNVERSFQREGFDPAHKEPLIEEVAERIGTLRKARRK